MAKFISQYNSLYAVYMMSNLTNFEVGASTHQHLPNKTSNQDKPSWTQISHNKTNIYRHIKSP